MHGRMDESQWGITARLVPSVHPSSSTLVLLQGSSSGQTGGGFGTGKLRSRLVDTRTLFWRGGRKRTRPSFAPVFQLYGSTRKTMAHQHHTAKRVANTAAIIAHIPDRPADTPPASEPSAEPCIPKVTFCGMLVL